MPLDFKDFKLKEWFVDTMGRYDYNLADSAIKFLNMRDLDIKFEDEDQNPILLPVSLDPAGYRGGAGFVMRDIPNSLDMGETGTISLKLRVAEPTDGAVIEEIVPAGFAISEISDGGVQNGQTITWTIQGELERHDYTYRISIPYS